MKIQIDDFTTITGWTANPDAEIFGLEHNPEYIAGNLPASLIFHFMKKNAYVEKIFAQPISIADAKEIIFSVWSRWNRKGSFLSPDDFDYVIDFGNTETYFFPTRQTFDAVQFAMPWTSVSKIRITKVTDGEDYLIVSNCLAARDEVDIDTLTGVLEELSLQKSLVFGNPYGLLIGTVSVYKDNDFVQKISPFLERQAVLTFVLGGYSEIHQLDIMDGENFRFTKLYDGKTIKRTMVGASIYLNFPIAIGKQESEIIDPGFALWGITPDFLPRVTKLDTVRDSWRADSGHVGESQARREGETMSWIIQIDVESRSAQMSTIASQIIRRVIGAQKVWVIGRRCKLEYLEGPVEEPRVDGVNERTKITYRVKIEIREDVFDRSLEYAAQSATLEINISPENALRVHGG